MEITELQGSTMLRDAPNIINKNNEEIVGEIGNINQELTQQAEELGNVNQTLTNAIATEAAKVDPFLLQRNKEYAVGDIVRHPAFPNVYFECIEAGVTGAEEPDFNASEEQPEGDEVE